MENKSFVENKITAQIDDHTTFTPDPSALRAYMVILIYPNNSNSVVCKLFNMNELCTWIASHQGDGNRYDFEWVINTLEAPEANKKPDWLSLTQVSGKYSRDQRAASIKVMIIPTGSCMVPTKTVNQITSHFTEMATNYNTNQASKEKERSPSPA